MALSALFVLLTGSSAWAAGHPGAPYGARDPAVCTSTTNPVSGGPSVAQAKAYFLCGTTGENEGYGSLYLISHLKLKVASSSRPYNSWTDSTPDIDPKQPVYVIGGSFIRYQCSKPDAAGAGSYPIGKNCALMEAAENRPVKASGICYKDAFADWHCRMTPLEPMPYGKSGLPPPRA
jgi:hypothetical protein